MANTSNTNSENDMSWKTALKERDDLNKFGSNKIGLFALALKFSLEDLESIGTASIVDGSGDKKNDLIYIDEESHTAVVIQAHESKSRKSIAPANKASDLNTAITWLLNMPESELPLGIKAHAIRLREGIKTNTISNLHVWYVHNCTESKNVEDELSAVKHTLAHALKVNFPNSNMITFVSEIGNSMLSTWHQETQSPIAVNDTFEFDCIDGYETKGNDWSSFVSVLPAQKLHEIYNDKGVKLFSANIRDYLGARSSHTNINNSIQRTLIHNPENFWVFNNGLTILTHKFKFDKNNKKLTVTGLAIVNGAQTTGAIGSLENLPSIEAKVPVRYVAVKGGNRDLIQEIVRYNNSQNQVTAADFRSTDSIQRRLRDEVTKIKDAEYEGGRRGGISSVIKRRPFLLPSFTVGQAIASFHGQPSIAYNKKSDIWINDATYSEFFNEKTTGAHLVFCYSLLKAIEQNKSLLIEKSHSQTELTKLEHGRLDFYRLPSSIFVYMNAISKALETILGRSISDYFTLSFGTQTTPKKAILNWGLIVGATAPLTPILSKAISAGLSKVNIDDGIQNFIQQVDISADNQFLTFDKFKKLIRNSTASK